MSIITDADIIQDTIAAPGPSGTVVGGETIIANTNRIATLEGLVVPVTKGIRSGRLYGPLETLSGWAAPINWGPGADFLNAAAFQWAIDAVVVGVRAKVGTAVAGGLCHFGIYSFGPTGVPDALVLDLGRMDCSAIGDRNTPPVNVALPRGSYWIAGATTVAGIQFECVLSGAGVTSILGHVDTTGTTPRSSVFRSTSLGAGFTALPATFGTVTTNFAIPAWWLVAQ